MRNVRYLTLLAGMLLLLSACGGGGEAEPVAEPEPAEVEKSAVDPEDVDDVLTAAEDVPEAVRTRAAEFLAVLGEGRTCSAWYWDAEDNAWECEIAGADYAKELDLGPDGAFQEVEYAFAGEQAIAEAPGLAEMILSSCDDPAGAEVEMSMRREELLATDPNLANWWEQDGIMFEVECPDGYEFEIDGFGVYVTDDDDDVDKD